MKIILTNTVDNLGRTGDIVNVADGYARNYLIPKQLAILADEKNVRQIRHKKKMLEHKLAKQLDELRDYAKQLEKVEITISRKAGENDKLFGSVTNQDIHAELDKAGIKVNRRAIQLPEPIKLVGRYKVTVKLAPEVDAQVKIWVVGESATPESAEAEAKA